MKYKPALRVACLILSIPIALAILSSPGDCAVFSFTGSVESAWSQSHGEITFETPEYYVGQTVTGLLYWNEGATEGWHSGLDLGNTYSVNSSPDWAEIYIGDIFFDLNQNDWVDLTINDGASADSVYATRTHTSNLAYNGVSYILDLPTITLEGPGDILDNTAYPDDLDLSLFSSGSIDFRLDSSHYLASAPGDYSLYGLFEAGIGIGISDISPVSVPEPSIMLILCAGCLVYGIRRKFSPAP